MNSYKNDEDAGPLREWEVSPMNQPNEIPTLDGSFPRKGIGNPVFTEEYANDTLRTLFERRTIRRYTDESVDPHDLDVIVDAGLRAANAGGCQAPIMLVSQDREVNQRLGRISNDLYDEGYYPVSVAQPSTACEVGITNAFYDAPVVITVFTPAGWSYAPLDAAVCAANMMNAAWSLGLGSCFVSRAARTFATPYGKEVRERAAIPDDYEPQLHVVLGHPESTESDGKPLYPNRVAWF